MRCFVSGASGFVGANLVHALNRAGHEVKALLRPTSDRRGLVDCTYQAVFGDLHDLPALERGLSGCDWAFHVAANYSLWMPDYGPMFRDNVEGTRHFLEAAVAAKCRRIVYTSTVGCIGLPHENVHGDLIPTDESTPVDAAQMKNPYKLSKWQAESVAREMAAKGAPIVIVNPSAPIGPRDVKPTPTGKLIVDFLQDKMPAYLDTGLNWVHVRDVAQGHILAAERGRVGERYILGHAQGNWSMKEFLRVLAEVSGRQAPRFQIPYRMAWLAAHFDESISRMTGKPPRAPIAGVRMARHKMYFDPSKAIRELGLPQTDPAQAIRDAVDWFRTTSQK